MWPNGSYIRILLHGGTPDQRALVHQYAVWWTAQPNITFAFVDSGPSEVRVTFDANGGSWSVIGTVCLHRAQHEPTMNLVISPSSIDQARATILHEFGHVLGAIHEHQSPLAQVPWNRPVVYAHHNPRGLSNAWVDLNILNQPFPTHEIDADADPVSIMVYAYPPTFTLDGSWVPWAPTLSARDFERIAIMYSRSQYVVSSFMTNQTISSPMEWHSITFGISP
ncbi:hypothetical protein J3458_002777 [Metarhizium acridum]|uniref:uncharacterized protein n=1 Tax=Metarhizium acridum TaxID=92637 RepID=UPI001C6CCCE6|nr:hypothetical protein J3458_002777 [Metarhizium acridum]